MLCDRPVGVRLLAALAWTADPAPLLELVHHVELRCRLDQSVEAAVGLADEVARTGPAGSAQHPGRDRKLVHADRALVQLGRARTASGLGQQQQQLVLELGGGRSAGRVEREAPPQDGRARAAVWDGRCLLVHSNLPHDRLHREARPRSNAGPDLEDDAGQ